VIDETADEQSTQAIESDTPIIETENMDSEVDFMKNSQSTNSPLAAKSLLAATQKMIGINPTEKVKPEPEEIVQQPTTPAKAVESEPKATAKTVESAPKATAKAATKATPKEEEKRSGSLPEGSEPR
jgi:phage I-like protein